MSSLHLTARLITLGMGAFNLKSAANGTIYWDEFESRRGSYIGLLP